MLFLYYEESLVSSNLNSNLLRFHCVRPNVYIPLFLKRYTLRHMSITDGARYSQFLSIFVQYYKANLSFTLTIRILSGSLCISSQNSKKKFKNWFIKEILCNFLVRKLQYLVSFLSMKTWKNHPQKYLAKKYSNWFLFLTALSCPNGPNR